MRTPRARASRDERRPHIELREDEHARRERVERDARIAARIERQILREVRVERPREPLGARREERVGELEIGALARSELQHRARLQPLAHRRRVHPEQRPRGVPRSRFHCS